MGLMAWPEFIFGSLVQNGVQNSIPPNLDVTYAENYFIIVLLYTYYCIHKIYYYIRMQKILV